MQQVLNSQERNQAFLKFLLFFLITVILIVSAIFFNFRLPLRENKMLQSEVDIKRVEELNQEKFTARLQDVVHYVDSLRSSTVNFENLSLIVDNKVNELSALPQSDQTIHGTIDRIIASALIDRVQDIKTMHTQAANLESFQQIKDDLQKTKDLNVTLNGQLDQLRRGGGVQ